MTRFAEAEQTEHFDSGLVLTFCTASKRWPLAHSYS